MLPAIFRDADVRGATQFCPQRNRMGLSLDVPGHGVMLFAITREHAEFLQICLDDYLNSLAGTQSIASGGMPNMPISVQPTAEGQGIVNA